MLEQRLIGLSCHPAEPDELTSGQNPQNSVRVSNLVTIECQKIFIKRIKFFKNLFLFRVLKDV